MDSTKNTAAKKPVVKAIDKISLFFASMLVSALTFAAIATDDPFADFLDTVEGWAQGALGVGIAITSVIFGAIRAVGNNNPMSALAGLALAAFIHWGPGIIRDMIIGSGAVLGLG
jgi:conjugal transfer pilus assembly protein TraA